MAHLQVRSVAAALGLVFLASLPVGAQTSAGDEVITMEPFNVTVYNGKIPIVDGFTGKGYEGSNEVVFDFARSFNKLLLGYHKKLVLDEVKHLQFRVKLGKDFEQEMDQLTTSFELGRFTLDHSYWLRRERAIITRLIREPFFKIKALIVWDLDRLNKMAPEKPDSKYARDIRYDPAAGRWERRITDRWEVFFLRNTNNPNNANRLNSAFTTEKTQGLNLDTQKGFHFIEEGLPVNVPSEAFREVSLTYPIFFSNELTGEKALRHLQETFIANLYFIYDPFSWVARRNTRFRGGFIRESLEQVQAARIYVDDRKWFDDVFARFLSDVVTIKLQGVDEIYSLHMLSKRLGDSPRVLGLGLDLLNWNKGEKRVATDRPEADARLSLGSTTGFRYVLIDAYQRFGNALVDRIRDRLLAQKAERKSINGRTLLTQIIEELSGMTYTDFAGRAKITQETNLNRFKMTRPGGAAKPTP